MVTDKLSQQISAVSDDIPMNMDSILLYTKGDWPQLKSSFHVHYVEVLWDFACLEVFHRVVYFLFSLKNTSWRRLVIN